MFKLPYENGVLCAIAFDDQGRQTGAASLTTANLTTRMSLLPECPSVKPHGLAYVHVCYTDENGVWKPAEKHELQATVQNGRLLGFGNAANFNPEGCWTNRTKTYYGEALAILRSDGAGPLCLRVSNERNAAWIEIPLAGSH